jgi:outer membrane receptor protein involved in Fe transport
VLLAVDQSINPNLSLFAQALYGHRSMAQEAGDFATRQRMSGKESNYSGTFGADARVSDGGSLAVSGSFATSDTDSTTINEGQVLPALEFTTKTAMYSADVVFRDSLWESAAGKVRYALGGQYRNESYDYRNPSSAEPRFNPDRNVSAAFAELRIPMWASGRPDGLPRIELSLADRQEHYSDFGSTNNPSGGLIWRALPGLAARATVGKSFKAPLFYDTNPGLTFAGGLALADPVAGDGSCAPFGVGTNCTNTLVIFGGNPDLKPERATTWTAGLDWTPQSMPNLKWSATYYNIHYKDRIAYFSDSISTFSAYAFESILGPILSRDPSAEIVQRYTSLPNYLNLLPGGGPVEAFLDGRSHNLSVLDTDGIDTDFNYSLPSSQGTWGLGLAGTYLLSYETKFSPSADKAALLNTVHNPIRLRLRGRLTWDVKSVSAALFVNHMGSYDDTRTTPTVPVASWTTLDVTGGYACTTCNGILENTRFTLGVLNLTDRNPPWVANPYNVNYDGANANALGRFFSLQVERKW